MSLPSDPSYSSKREVNGVQKGVEFTAKDVAKCYGKRTLGGIARYFSRKDFEKKHNGAKLTKHEIIIGLGESLQDSTKTETKPRSVKITKEPIVSDKIKNAFFKKIKGLGKEGIENLIESGLKIEMDKSEKKEINEFLSNKYSSKMDREKGLVIANKLYENKIDLNDIELLLNKIDIVVISNSVGDIIKLNEKFSVGAIVKLINTFPNDEMENYISIDDAYFLAEKWSYTSGLERFTDSINTLKMDVDEKMLKDYIDFFVNHARELEETHNIINLSRDLALMHDKFQGSNGKELIGVFHDFVKLRHAGFSSISSEIIEFLTKIERNEENLDNVIKLHSAGYYQGEIPPILDWLKGDIGISIEDFIKLSKTKYVEGKNIVLGYKNTKEILELIEVKNRKDSINDILKLLESDRGSGTYFRDEDIAKIMNEIPIDKRDIDKLITDAKLKREQEYSRYKNTYQNEYNPNFVEKLPEDININIPRQATSLISVYEEYKAAKESNDYLNLFGLDKNYTEKQVEDAFKKKFALKLHPDKNKEFSKEAEELFKLFKNIRDFLISQL